MDEWSGRWWWVRRAEAWDEHQEDLLEEERTNRRRQAVEFQATLGRGLQAKAAQNLGNIGEKALTGSEVARMAHAGVVIERMALGMPMGNGIRVEGRAQIDESGDQRRVQLRIVLDDDDGEETS